jgi:ribonuclease HI
MARNNDNIDRSDWPTIRIWTDGSACPENPGPGGWAALLRYRKYERMISGSSPWSSNIRMELLAVLRAVQQLKVPSNVIIYTDSQYIIDGFRNIIHRNKLLKSHYDIWGLLLHFAQLHHILVKKVKAHSGHVENDRVDEEARRCAIEQVGDPFLWPTEKKIEELRLQSRGIEKRSWEY